MDGRRVNSLRLHTAPVVEAKQGPRPPGGPMANATASCARRLLRGQPARGRRADARGSGPHHRRGRPGAARLGRLQPRPVLPRQPPGPGRPVHGLHGRPPSDVPHAYTATAPGPMTERVLRDGAQLILRPQAAAAAEGLVPFGDTGRLSLLAHVRPRAPRLAGPPACCPSRATRRTPTTRTIWPLLQELADHCGGAIERLRIEDALRESQAQLARAEAFALVMTAHLSLDGRWLKVPPTLCQLLEVEQRELLGTSDRRAAPSRATWSASGTSGSACCAARRRSVDLETRWLLPSGAVRWMYLNASIVLDADGQPLYLLVVPPGRDRAQEPRGPAPCRRRRWRRSGSSPAGSRTTSTTC